MKEKKYKYKLTDSFVDKCVNALAFYDIIGEISALENESEDEFKERMNKIMSDKKAEYRVYFLENQ